MPTAVIMAGGRGERFWPLSREDHPKQLLRLNGRRSLLQQTVDRICPFTGKDRVYVVTASHLRQQMSEQLPELSSDKILVEPEGRNTAACIALAVAHLRAAGACDDEVMIVLPADHAVLDHAGFHRTLEFAVTLLEKPEYANSLVTIGIRPTRPETGYGYMHLGPATGETASEEELTAHRVQSFVEKPDRARAEQYVGSGEYLWNSGMFIWRLRAIEEALRQHLPELALAMERVKTAVGTPRYSQVLRQVYAQIPSVSIDYGVMEKAEDILCIPAALGWDDVGTWSALGRLLPPDKQGNAVYGRHVGVDTHGCLVYSNTDRMVATAGLTDVVIVDTEDALLVCHKDAAQQVRDVVAALRQDPRYSHLTKSAKSVGTDRVAAAGGRSRPLDGPTSWTSQPRSLGRATVLQQTRE